MGRYSFTIPDDDRFVAESFSRAQIIGLDGIPWTSSSAIQEDNLVITRHVDISGRLLVPFRTSHHGILHLPTGTLPESGSPWRVEIELARGCLNRLRNQVSIWQESGLQIPSNTLKAIEAQVAAYSEALFSGGSASNGAARKFGDIVDDVVDLMVLLTREFTRQVEKINKSDPKFVPVHCGVRVISSEPGAAELPAIQLVPRFDSIVPETQMIDVRPFGAIVNRIANTAAGQFLMCGPVIDFSDAELPVWLRGTTTFEQRLALIKMVCRDIGLQYGKSIRLFNPVAGISGVGHQYFNYPQQLQMAVEVMEVVDRTMPNTSTVLGFDQPWAERLSMANGGVPAIEIAESLLRYGTRLTAAGLEFLPGYAPQGTFLRDPLQWIDLVDRWAQFGLPLVVYLAAPLPTSDGKLPASRFAQTVSETCRAPEFVEHLVMLIELLKSRPSVNVVVWKYATDAENPRFPLSGLLDERGRPKPATNRILEALRG
jgi:hypothetical protein